jgi:hypothetical protein
MMHGSTKLKRKLMSAIYSFSKDLRNWSAVFFFSSTICCKEGPYLFVENLEFTTTDIYV